MRRIRQTRSKLQLESLESRVMLAAGDAPSPEAVQAVDSAIESTDQLRVELLPYDEWLGITGTGSGDLQIDLSLLPESLRTLYISNFDSVTLVGSTRLENLVFANVDFADAGRAVVDELFTYGVAHIRIDTAPEIILLQGANGYGSLGTETLLEVNRFSSSSVATIFAHVERLGLAVNEPGQRVPDIISPSDQAIYLNYRPEEPLRVQDESRITVQVVEGSDFTKYFFATPEQRDVLEAAPTFSLTLADVVRVPLAALLGNSKLQAAIHDSVEFSGKVSLQHAATEVLLANTPDAIDLPVAKIDLSTVSSPDGALVPAHELPSLAVQTGVLDLSGSLMAPTAVPSLSSIDSPAVSMTFLDAPIADGSASPHSAVSALTAALARMTQPLLETAENLQGHLATFGALASAEVADHMRADNRPALLVDARSARAKDLDSFVVVNV